MTGHARPCKGLALKTFEILLKFYLFEGTLVLQAFLLAFPRALWNSLGPPQDELCMTSMHMPGHIRLIRLKADLKTNQLRQFQASARSNGTFPSDTHARC